MNPNYHIMKDGTYVYHCRFCKKTFREDYEWLEDNGYDSDIDAEDNLDIHEKTHEVEKQ